MSNKTLEETNKEHFKDNLNAVKFCSNCDIENKLYCSFCAQRQINKLDNFSIETEADMKKIKLILLN
jgi:hypothetical protein